MHRLDLACLAHGAFLVLSTVMCAAVSAQEIPSPPPQVAISPPRFELEVGAKPTPASFRVINLGENPLEIRVSVTTWELDEQNQVVDVEPTEQSLDRWMIVNPLRFVVEGGESQNVRFSIRPRVAPEPGEHRAMIYLDQVLPENGNTDGVRMRFRYGVAVYGYVGEVLRSGTLHGIEVAASPNHLHAKLDISSLGTAHVRLKGQYAIWKAEDYPGASQTSALSLAADQPLPTGVLFSGDLPSLPVLPGSRRTLVLHRAAVLPPGSYVLDLNGDLSGTSVDQGIPFTVPEPKPPDDET